jgi:hypothetical protein
MKLFCEPRMWMPLAGLGITLALAPQSRAQADAAPDNFEVAYSATPAPAAKVLAPKAKPPVAPSAQAANKKHTQPTLQVTSAKNVSDSERPDALAIQDQRQTPPRKPNNQ